MLSQLNDIDSRKNYYIYTILVLLTLYSDSPLRGPLGFFGETMIPVVVLPLYFYFFLIKKEKYYDEFLLSYKKILIYVTVLSVFYYLFFQLIGIQNVLMGDNLFIKGIKLFVQFFTYYAYIKVLCLLCKGYTFEDVLRPFYWGSILLTIILIIELIQIPNAFESLHYSPCPYYRVRLLGSEASYTSLPLEIFFIFSFIYCISIKRSFKATLLLSVCFISHIIFSGSKTFLVVILIMFFASLWIIKKNQNNMKSFFIILTIGIIISSLMVNYMLPKLIASFMNDIEEYSSTVTRFYSIYCGFEIGITHPLGVGFQSYLYYLPQALEENKWIIKIINPDLNLVEIDGYIDSDTSKAVAAKSFLGQSSIYWGILGTIYFVRMIIVLIKNTIINSNIPYSTYIIVVTYILLIQLFLSSGLTFEILAFISILIYIKNNICYE